MTLRQLRYLREIVCQGLSLSQAAAVLHTSQPGISKQIKALEKEVGVVIFQRRRNKILGLTGPGREITRFAERTLREAQNIRNFGDEFLNRDSGNLVIATTHTHARYTLPPIIGRFTRAYPRVKLEFWQGNRDEIFRWVDSGEADIAVGTDSDNKLRKVAMFPFQALHRIVVTRPTHPLLRFDPLTLEQLAKYPLITYGFRSNDRWKFSHVFEAKRIEPNIVFSAIDADIAKAYVELGIGIAILPDVTYNRSRDKTLRARDVRHLFETEIMHVGVNRDGFLRKYIFDFLNMLSAQLTRTRIEQALYADEYPIVDKQ